MIRIRLKRLGRKRQPHYRIVVCDQRARREGAPIEELGYYNPRHKLLKLDKEKALDWITKGAQPSETVVKLIESCGEDGQFSPEAKEYRLNRKTKLKEAKKAKEEEAKKAKEEEEKAKEAASASA
ncbi:MAG: 30S ribosomal protein S16 [Cyanobacteriota bacterium]